MVQYPRFPSRIITPAKYRMGPTSRQVTHLSRLSEIPLPKFDDDFHMGPTFRDRFIALVYVRLGLSNIDILYYLMGYLQGTELGVILGIPASNENYKLAWLSLSFLFYRPCMVATLLIDKLVVAPLSSLHDLTIFLATFDENISSINLSNLGSLIVFRLVFRALPLGTSCSSPLSQTTLIITLLVI